MIQNHIRPGLAQGSLICHIFQRPTVSLSRTVGGPWTPCWKPLNLLFITPSPGKPPAWGPRQLVKPEKWYFHCYCFNITPTTAKANGACSYVSSVMVRRHSHRPTEPTRTRWVRLRVGLNTYTCRHTHTHTHTLLPFTCYFSPCLFFLFITLSSPSEPLKLWGGLAGVPPLVSMVTIQYAPVASPAQHLLPWQETMVVVETRVGFVYVLLGHSPDACFDDFSWRKHRMFFSMFSF